MEFLGNPTSIYRLANHISVYGYAPVIRLKMAISGRHAHIHTDKTDISR